MKLLDCHNYKSHEWLGSDTKELYEKNLAIQPKDWYWRTHQVHYTTNSQRYRAAEWNTIDWCNSILVFGCSQTFGIGVDDDQTVCHQLSKMLNVNVVNLGMPGGSCMGVWINTQKLLHYTISPLAVIYNWPAGNRLIELVDDTKNAAAGPWMLEYSHKRFGTDWVMHLTQGLEYAKYAVMSAKHSWSCPQIHHTWDADLAKFLKLPRQVKVDEARDCMHHGPMSYTTWAESWADELSRKLEI